MSGEVIESVENLGKIVEGSSSSGRYFFDYLTKGATFSVNQESYELGQEGGGVEWSAEDLEVLTTTQVVLHNRANSYFEENYINTDIRAQRCQIDDQGFNIVLPNPNNQVDRESVHIAGSVISNIEEVKTNCQFDESRLQIHATEGFYRARYNSSFNRYFQLVDETISIYEDLRATWSSAPVEYTASSSSCGSYPSEGQVEEIARQQAVDEFEERLQYVERDHPELEGAGLELEFKDIDYEVEGTSKSTGDCCDEGDPYCAEYEDDDEDDGGGYFDPCELYGYDPYGDTECTSSGISETLGDLVNRIYGEKNSLANKNRIQGAYLKRVQSCGPDCIDCNTPCNAYTHTTEVTIEVNEVFAESTLTDTRYKILTKDGWQNLEFQVDNYNQDPGATTGTFGGLGGFSLGSQLFGQSSQVLTGIIQPGATTQDTQSWVNEREIIYEQESFDVQLNEDQDGTDSTSGTSGENEDTSQDRDNSESTEQNPFQIQLGNQKSLPNRRGSIYFFDQYSGLHQNLLFRTQAGVYNSDGCEGTIISGKSLTSFDSTPPKCGIGGVGTFESGEYTVGICDYESSSETATVAVLSSSATTSDIANACAGGSGTAGGSGEMSRLSASGDVSLNSCGMPQNALVKSKFENGPMQPFNTGDDTHLSTVSSGSYDGDSLRVEIPAGNHYGFGGGHTFSEAGQSEPEELYAQYMLKFGDNWDPGAGWTGKLPGFAGRYGESGWGGRKPSGDDGWSARGGFTNDGEGNTDIGFYNYHVGIDEWGDTYADGSLENGQWYCVKQHIQLNTPGENDGLLEAWVDGEKIVDKKDIRWRDTDDLKIEEYWFDIYFGGSETPDESQSVYFDNFAVTKDESIIQ